MRFLIDVEKYKGRKILDDEKVSVYRNLHKNKLTVRVRNIVHGHADIVRLTNVEFRVGASGNEKVNKENRKNVHATVNGNIISADKVEDVSIKYTELEESGYKRVYYNPYKVTSFVYFDDMKPVYNTREAIVVMDRVYVK